MKTSWPESPKRSSSGGRAWTATGWCRRIAGRPRRAISGAAAAFDRGSIIARKHLANGPAVMLDGTVVRASPHPNAMPDLRRSDWTVAPTLAWFAVAITIVVLTREG